MSSNIEKINLWFDRFDKKFSGFPDIIAETAVEYYQERFTQRNWDGQPWPKRKDNKGHELLMKSKNLFRSFSTITSPEMIKIRAGSLQVPYARIHNEGGRVTGTFGVRAYTNKNFMGKGKQVPIRAHTRKVDFVMPRRQFMGISATLNKRIMDRLKAYYNAANT